MMLKLMTKEQRAMFEKIGVDMRSPDFIAGYKFGKQLKVRAIYEQIIRFFKRG